MSFLYSQFLGVFLSALKVQSKNVSLIYAGHCTVETEGRSDNYLLAACSGTNSSQCEARADGESKGESKVKTT